MTEIRGPFPHLMRQLCCALTVIAASALLTACSPTGNDSRSATAGLPDVLQQLTANPWLLNPTASSPSFPGGAAITARFTSAKTVTGQAPCNTYGSDFTLDGATIHVGHVSQTLKACPSAADASTEHRYFELLQHVQTVEPSDRDQLRLSGSGGLLLVYTAIRG